MPRDPLKHAVFEAIDAEKETIIALGESLYARPELGYREHFATEQVAELFTGLGFDVEKNIAVTGVAARPTRVSPGPVVSVLGELDAIVCPEHPDADPDTGAVHACGHHIQVAAMAGVALGLSAAGAFDHLDGTVNFMAVPAEEFVEMAFRARLKQEGKITWYGGKQELIAKGFFDTTDIAMMAHALDLGPGPAAVIGATGNGFIGKEIRFTGKEAHAGAAPHDGVNALNAAMLAMMNIHAQRETFRDEDHIRVHPILTKGGDAVNVVPADVRMESFVRGRTIQGMQDASKKVDRAIQAGAMAVGASSTIHSMPGYLPLLTVPELDALFKENALPFCGPRVIEGAEFAGSFDMGDLSHLIPCLHPFTGGVTGNIHTREFSVSDPEAAYLFPAKALAGTLIDLLRDGAKKGKAIIDGFSPRLTKAQYLGFLETTLETRTVDQDPL
ncbi:amidohydrolase [Desulfoluna spongiiphila]|uniref:Peptidase M20 domain-containing protein 2 n=1 Tax=Desulfoluna spongiiphila TaxID=419481 RepID=A0A1G5EIJ3_9BACT|nr:amidohydrolase [Desulfoluna spongiiphila]SCY26785.1 amidohydrolase [Desulfoluna spongiiphila]VVS91148.1 amidohydrolase [Desulfoluna spongiiphila]